MLWKKFLEESIDLSFWTIFDLAIVLDEAKALVASLGKFASDWANLETPSQKQ